MQLENDVINVGVEANLGANVGYDIKYHQNKVVQSLKGSFTASASATLNFGDEDKFDITQITALAANASDSKIVAIANDVAQVYNEGLSASVSYEQNRQLDVISNVQKTKILGANLSCNLKDNCDNKNIARLLRDNNVPMSKAISILSAVDMLKAQNIDIQQVSLLKQFNALDTINNEASIKNIYNIASSNDFVNNSLELEFATNEVSSSFNLDLPFVSYSSSIQGQNLQRLKFEI